MLRQITNTRKTSESLPTTNQGRVSRKMKSSISGRMPHLPWKWFLFVAFLVAYCVFTFKLSSFHHACPDPMDGSGRVGSGIDLSHVAVGSLERLARSMNDSKGDEVSNRLREKLVGPLAKLGIRLPEGQGGLAKKSTPSPDPSSPPPTGYASELLPPSDILDPKYTTDMVFYVWCGRRWFEFQHYISIMSVMRALRPDNLLFYYDTYPVVDSWTYNTWLGELRHELPFLRFIEVTEADKACNALEKPNLDFIYRILTKKGGMYVNEFTIISEFPVWYRNHSIVHGLDTTSGRGFLMTQPGLPGSASVDQLVNDRRYVTRAMHCVTVSQYVKAHRKPPCVLTSDPFFPKDIWDLDNSFGRLVRRIFYGSPDIHLPQQNYDELIPNIAHVVWIGGGEMDYLFYLCVLSLVYVAEVDMVYIHGDGPPTGAYWESIKDLEKVTLIYRETPGTVYQTQVNVLSHVTDVWRVDFMIKYGGIYVDTDTVFVRPLDRQIRAYDAVGSYDWTYWNHPFPDTINFGVAIGKRNAKYWHLFQESMRWFMDQDWAWNGLRQPYRIKERHPEMVRIDPRLQVICFESKCHPTWWPDYHNESIHHLNSNSIPNWREDVYAFHWTLPTPVELLSEDHLLRSNSIFAQIGKNVLQKAGRLKSVQ